MRRRSRKSETDNSRFWPKSETSPKFEIGNRNYAALVSVSLVLATLFAFSGVLSQDSEFLLWDDGEYVVDNPQVQAGLTAESIAWAFTTFHASNWHPLTWLSLELDYELYGLKPWGFHLTNVLLHAVSAVTLFLALLNMTAAFWRSALVAALFTLHPLRTESVAWIAERKDVLSAAFWMLTLAAYAWYVRNPGVRRYLLVAAVYALGLMAKPMLVTLPCVLLLLDCWPLDRVQLARRASEDSNPRLRVGLTLFLEKIPLFVLAAVASALTVLAQQEALGSLTRFPLETRLVNSVLAYIGYLGKTLFPINLSPYYSRPAGELPVTEAVVAAIAVVGITIAVAWYGRRRRYLAVGWLWYLGTLVPVIGLVQVGVQTMADRYTYIPQIGFWILLVWGLADLCERWNIGTNVRAVAVGAVLLGSLVGTFILSGLWANNIALWQHAVEATPESFGAHDNLGTVLLEKRRPEEAIRQLRTAIQLEPNYAPAHVHLANALMDSGQTDEALDHYRVALKLQPDSVGLYAQLARALQVVNRWHEAIEPLAEAARRLPTSPLIHYNLGNVYLLCGREQDALHQVQESLRLDPQSKDAHNLYGLLLMMQGELAKAEAEFRTSLAISAGDKRSDGPALYYLGWTLHALGRDADSREQYRVALQRFPAWPQFMNGRAWPLATHPDANRRNGRLALQWAEVICQATNDGNADYLDTLAAAHAELHQFAAALRVARKALEADPQDKNKRGEREQRLQTYEKGQPWRQGP